MALGGMWHGASMHYLAWGAYQGILLIAHKEYSKVLAKIGVGEAIIKSKLYHAVSVVMTFQFVCLGWILFRADNLGIAWTMVKKMAQAPAELMHFSTSQLAVLEIRDPLVFPALVLIIPALMIAHVLVNWLNDKKFYQSPPWAVQVGVMVVLMCVLTIFSPDNSPKFIYFQF
jgi:hypothetical protein